MMVADRHVCKGGALPQLLGQRIHAYVVGWGCLQRSLGLRRSMIGKMEFMALTGTTGHFCWWSAVQKHHMRVGLTGIRRGYMCCGDGSQDAWKILDHLI
jgi:hypothetical protein